MLILVSITKNYKLVSVGWFFIGLTDKEHDKVEQLLPNIKK